MRLKLRHYPLPSFPYSLNLLHWAGFTSLNKWIIVGVKIQWIYLYMEIYLHKLLINIQGTENTGKNLLRPPSSCSGVSLIWWCCWWRFLLSAAAVIHPILPSLSQHAVCSMYIFLIYMDLKYVICLYVCMYKVMCIGWTHVCCIYHVCSRGQFP